MIYKSRDTRAKPEWQGVYEAHTSRALVQTRKKVPITGRANSFLVFLEFQKQNKEEGGTKTTYLPKVITFPFSIYN